MQCMRTANPTKHLSTKSTACRQKTIKDECPVLYKLSLFSKKKIFKKKSVTSDTNYEN